MHSPHRNVGLLAACQAMLFTNNSTLIAINGLAGLALTPYAALATLPVSCWILGSALATMPASLHMKRVGRQAGRTSGTFWAVAGALICATAIGFGSFWLLCGGTLVWGVYNAYGQYYRFAAADVATPEYRPTAISLVLAGGLVGGIVGPTLSRWTVDLADKKFKGAYLVLIAFAIATMVLLRFIRIPAPSAAERSASGRPLREIAAQPKFIVAVLAAALGYGVMNFLMTSTPIAMLACGHDFGSAAFVISSHIIGMFGPSIFTGTLIRRFGVLRVMMAGAALHLVPTAIAFTGISVAQFSWALVLLGVGWNFLYTGGTTLLTQTYRPEGAAQAHGANEQDNFPMMLLAPITPGGAVTPRRWGGGQPVSFPPVLVLAPALRRVSPADNPRPAGA